MKAGSRGRLAWSLGVLTACVGSGLLRAADALPDPAKLPPPADKKIDYARDIAPIFENTCFRCHGPNRPKSHFRLNTRESALKGGDDGGDILPGDSARSRLSFYVARLVEDKEMPPAGKGDPLTATQVGLLRAWIDQGANYAGTNIASSFQFAVEPALRFTSVSGNVAKFREMFGQREGWGGGLQSFSLTQTEKNGAVIHADGQALFPDQDYRLRLKIDKPELGFIEGGFEQFRTYYDDTGWYSALLTPSSYSLNRDLHLDDGKAWINFGLNQPNRPKIILGYEYDYRTGTKSMLEYGAVTAAATATNNIYPSFQHLNEHTHILKLDFEHEFYSVKVEDNFKVEFYRMNDQTTDSALLFQGQSGPQKNILTTQTEDHFQAGNAFRLSKDVFDWWYLSAGYLYTRLNGDSGINQNAVFTPLTPPSPPLTTLLAGYPLWNADDIVLNQDSHTVNLNSFLGSWHGLSLSTGVEGQWMRQQAFGNIQTFYTPSGTAGSFTNSPVAFGDMDLAMAVEQAVLKYEAIPFTILSAEGRLQQESRRYSQSYAGGIDDFNVNTDEDIDIKEVRAGLSTSPWQCVSFGFDLMRRETVNHYNNVGLSSLGAYPGYILAHDFTTDEAAAKLVLRPARWLKATFSYRVDSTDYQMQGADLTLIGGSGISSTAPFQNASYNSHIYDASVLLTPWQRVTLSGSFGYFDTRIRTVDSGLDSVTAYSGGTYVAQTQASFAVNDSNDLRVGYNYSQSDFGQNNSPAGLPLGLDYTLHGIKAGWVHKMKGNKSVALEYTFYRYREPTLGTVNDFDAHSVFVSYTMRWP